MRAATNNYFDYWYVFYIFSVYQSVVSFIKCQKIGIITKFWSYQEFEGVLSTKAAKKKTASYQTRNNEKCKTFSNWHIQHDLQDTHNYGLSFAKLLFRAYTDYWLGCVCLIDRCGNQSQTAVLLLCPLFPKEASSVFWAVNNLY